MFPESECLVLNVSVWSKSGAGELMCCGGVREYDKKAMEGDPMIYIVIMLFVFSAGIASLMIIYMKKEQRDQEDANLYKIYVEAARDRYSEYLNRGRSVNKLALQALNAVNLISQYQEEEGNKVTFV